MSSSFKDIKINTTVSVLVHGGNPLGLKIAKTLLEQGGRVIIVDSFNSRSKSIVSELKKLGAADFVDFSGLESLYKTLKRIDYVYYLLSEYLTAQESFSSRDFLEESNYLNQTLKASLNSDAKLSLVTSIKLNEQLSAYILSSNLNAPSPYSSIELQKYCETLTAEYRDKSKMKARIIRLGTLLGKDIDELNDKVLEEILTESSNKGFITIKGEGLGLHYLINIEDAVYGILKLTFQTKTEGEVVSLTNNNDYTTLSIAYKLLEINSEISDIKFTAADKNQLPISYEHYIPAPNASNFGWKQGTTLESSLVETIEKFHPKTGQIIKKQQSKVETLEEKVEVVSKTRNVKTPLGTLIDKLFRPFSRITRSSSNNITRFRQSLTPQKMLTLVLGIIATILITIFIVYPAISIGLGGYLTYKSLQKAKDYAVAFESDKSVVELEKAQKYIERISTSFGQTKWLFSITNNSQMYENTTGLIFASQYGIKGAKEIAVAITPLSEYINSFEPALGFQNSLPSSSREYRDYLVTLKENSSLLQKGVYNINIASDLIQSVQVSTFPTYLQPYISQLKEYNDLIDSQITPIEKVITFLPEILGLEERVRYLVLFQNPDELRSSGGWISSYALISFEGGQIRELKVDDIYNLDGDLTNANISHPAPVSMRDALEIDEITHSLSNWSPDLQSVTSLNEQLLNKIDPGAKLDGTITIDTEVLKSLLSVWGEIIIPGESQPITAENLDEKIFNMHKQFQPGESLKSPFLANLSNTILQKVLTAKISEIGNIGTVFLDSLESKNITIYLKNREAYEYLSQNRWSGTVHDSYKSAPFTVEWNWGANKVNSKIERSITHNIDILSEEGIEYTYNLALRNTATTKVYPLGDYTNYLRVYIPENAEIRSVTGFTETDYQIYLENGFKVIGGWLNVPIQTSKAFEIKYVIGSNSSYQPITIDQEDIQYDLTVYKQPGTREDTVAVNITYPESWALISNEGLDNVLNQLLTQTKLDKDLNYNIVWNRK